MKLSKIIDRSQKRKDLNVIFKNFSKISDYNLLTYSYSVMSEGKTFPFLREFSIKIYSRGKKGEHFQFS